jgi:hypothetical protein
MSDHIPNLGNFCAIYDRLKNFGISLKFKTNEALQ